MQATATLKHTMHTPSPARSAGAPHLRPVTFHAPEAVIYAQGDDAQFLYRIQYGAVRVFRLLADGRRQIVAFYLTGETFGFEIGATHGFYAEAMVNTGLTTVERCSAGTLPHELVEIALKAMIRAQEHLLVVGRQSALEKIAVFLLDLVERQGGGCVIDLPMSRADTGDYLGLTIETVSRTISKLRAMGIIHLQNARCLEIVKPDRLRMISM
jgi:CRP/FNR family transcriptional regulator, nitrogen fixation regulation protein